MDESTGKTMKIGIIVVCLVVAIVITVKTRSGGSSGRGDFGDSAFWVKCDECGVEKEMEQQKYLEDIKEVRTSQEIPPLACDKCGKNAIYRAIKCKKCETVFFYSEFYTKNNCPKCGYNEITARKEERLKARSGAAEEWLW